MTDLPAVSNQSSWDVTQRQAKAFLASGYLKEEFTKGVDLKTAIAKVATIICMGDELGIGRMQALRSINVIKGKPCLAADLMLALAYNRIPDFSVEWITPAEKQHLECVAIFSRRGKSSTFRWTIEDAKRAGLIHFGGAWEKYPRALLRARVLTEGLRAVAPDATMGLMSLEEMGQEVIEIENVNTPIDEVKQIEPEPTLKKGSAAKQAISAEEKAANEIDGGSNLEPGEQTQVPHAVITEKQAKRMWAISKKNNWSEQQLRDHLKQNYQIESTRDVRWLHYDGIINFIQSHPQSDSAE